MKHEISTYAWAAVILVATGLQIGWWLGVQYGPSYHDAKVIERRLREVFCEQAIRNGLIKSCEVTLKGE